MQSTSLLITVQEQMMVRQSRNLIGWLDGYGPNGSVEDTFAFLPRSLSPTVLLYPGLGMFGDLSVHRLCFYAGKIMYSIVLKTVWNNFF